MTIRYVREREAKDWSYIDLDLEVSDIINDLLIKLDHPLPSDQKIALDLLSTLKDFVARHGMDREPPHRARLPTNHPHYERETFDRLEEARLQDQKRNDFTRYCLTDR